MQLHLAARNLCSNVFPTGERGSVVFSEHDSTERVARALRILHVTNWLSRRGGGLPPVIWSLARESQAIGHECFVAGLEDEFCETDCHEQRVPFFTGRVSGPSAVGFSRELRKFVPKVPKGDIVHSHGLWMYPGTVARQKAEGSGARLIISPHGMLEPWTLKFSRWKKRAFAWAFENRNLRKADCLHALCKPEGEHFRAYGLRNPIAVIPNGISAEQCEGAWDRDRVTDRIPNLKGKRRLLFLSRIHPKKGLVHLLKGWAAVQQRQRLAAESWVLIMAGPEEVGHGDELRKLAQELRVGESVQFVGPVYGEEKRSLYGGVDAFVLPSFSEGFSMAILEAAAAGLPVVLTRECNFPELAIAGGGVEITADERGVVHGLSQVLAMSDQERDWMGGRGRELVKRSYTWGAVARQMLSLYEWLKGSGTMPAFVRLN